MKIAPRNRFSAVAIALLGFVAAFATPHPRLTAGLSPLVGAQRLDHSGAPSAPADDDEASPPPGRHPRRRDHDQVAIFSDNHVLAAQVVQGSAVAIGGNLDVDGSVNHDAVAVVGNLTVNGTVHGSAVAVCGDLILGPKAFIGGDAVCTAGHIYRDPSAVVVGDIVVKDFGFHGHVSRLFAPLRQVWFGGPASRPFWLWVIFFLGLCAVIASVFPHGVKRCGDLLVIHPGLCLLAAFLAMLALPVLVVLLMVSVVGIPVALFVLPPSLVALAIFGKTSIYALIGRSVSRDRLHPAIAVFLGGLICLCAFLIPIAGLILFFLLGVPAVGCVIVAIVSSMKGPGKSPPPSAPVAPSPATASELPPVLSAEPPPLPPSETAAVSLPRAGFWIRLGALAIDALLVAVVSAPLLGHLYLLVLAAYGAFMWKAKAATIGGIICGLKVVRLDARPIDWPTAVARTLGCFLSLIVVGLGFIWVGLDPERQSWHDKIAGTTVVRLRRGISLV